MSNFFYDNWMGIIGVISAPLAYVFGGKQRQNVELKKGNADAVSTMQSVYDDFLQDYKYRMDEVMDELKQSRLNYNELQRQFNSMNLSYTHEVEVSQNWEKLHREMTIKYDALKKDHDLLRKEVEALRKKTK